MGDGVLLLFSMADSKFILYVRKFLKNPLLARKQMVSLTHSTLNPHLRVVAWLDPPRDGKRVQDRHHRQAQQDPQG